MLIQSPSLQDAFHTLSKESHIETLYGRKTAIFSSFMSWINLSLICAHFISICPPMAFPSSRLPVGIWETQQYISSQSSSSKATAPVPVPSACSIALPTAIAASWQSVRSDMASSSLEPSINCTASRHPPANVSIISKSLSFSRFLIN